MACVDDNQTLTASMNALLQVLSTPLTAEQLAEKTSLPLFKVRSTLRELENRGYIKSNNNIYEKIK
jgi:sugar-specific transcriptional regulator TrmB